VTSIDGRVCVDAVESSRELRTFVPIGEELPLWAGSAGKVFLAAMLPEQAERHIRRMRALTTATPTAERLRRQVATVRRQGWAASAGERQEGVGSVSAPVHGPLGATIAAVSSQTDVAHPSRRRQRYRPRSRPRPASNGRSAAGVGLGRGTAQAGRSVGRLSTSSSDDLSAHRRVDWSVVRGPMMAT
jgi:DNA-binding IclR family transcriptional regulator